MIEINSIVPEVSLMGSDKKEHSLSEYKGNKIVLYFILEIILLDVLLKLVILEITTL